MRVLHLPPLMALAFLTPAMVWAQPGGPRVPTMDEVPPPAVLAPAVPIPPVQRNSTTPPAPSASTPPATTQLSSPAATGSTPPASAPARAVTPTPAGTQASAAGTAASTLVQPIINGIRIPMAADRTAVPVAARPALLAFLRAIPADNTSRITITAYAAGAETDLSTPRRLSLQRARAAMEILVEAGANPRRIDLRPMGIARTDITMPDRLDIILGVTSR